MPNSLAPARYKLRPLSLHLAGPAALGAALLSLTTHASAEAPGADAGWQACVRLEGDDSERLACFDRWASAQRWQQVQQASTDDAHSTPVQPQDAAPAAGPRQAAAQAPADLASPIATASAEGCRDRALDSTSRYWELTSDTDCGNFRLRGYRPQTIAVSVSDRINRQPYSPSPLNGLASYQPYQHEEANIQLSVRTKLASNLLTRGHPSKRDSLWFGYTLNANWQVFNAGISRPFRNTDHQPEIMYVYPLEWQLPGDVRLRYAGLGLNHQSNGRSNPLSRSWNRYYAMLGADIGSRWFVQGRFWQRVSEDVEDDDNPNIERLIGRAELLSNWTLDDRNSLALTLRHSLQGGRGGSARLEWYHALGEGFAGGRSNLHLYTGIFHGYGDSTLDYNFKRTVLTVGLSLLDF